MLQLVKRNRFLILIFLFALLLRCYKLTTLPIGFHSDEVRVGWNAYSILKTGMDDRGNTLAFYYNTFGDYRPTGIFYLTIPSIFLFGLTEFAVRLPSAFLGALTVIPLYLLVTKLTNNKSLALLSAFFLSISPWHITVSRATSEVVISMFFALFALYFFIKALNKDFKKYLFVALLFFSISYLFYHTVRLLAPLFVITTALYYWSTIHKNYRNKIIVFIMAIFFLTAIFVTNKASQGRFSQVSIANDLGVKLVLSLTNSSEQNKNIIFDNKYAIYAKNFLGQYLTYFSGEFLIGDSAKPIRYRSSNIGLLTYFGFVLFLVGVVYCIKTKNTRHVLLLLLVSPLAAALTTEDAPNLHRSLFMIPFISILLAHGLISLIKVNRLVVFIFIVGAFLNYIYFWQVYAQRSDNYIAFWRDYSAKELAYSLEHLKDQYEEVIVTNDPDDPYPWYAFYTKRDPKEFNSFAINRSKGPWTYNNITFTQKECPSGEIFPGPKDPPSDKNILVIDGFKCPIESKIKDGMQAKVFKQLFNPDGTVAYTFWIKK